MWDEELAKMAQTWAQQCVMNHDTCRDVSKCTTIITERLNVRLKTKPLT